MSRRRQSNPAGPVVVGLLASVLLHLVLWPVGNGVVGLADRDRLPQTPEVMEVSLLPESSTDSADPKPPELPEVVSLDAVRKERRPRDATRRSELDSSVAKETVARPAQRSTPKGRPAADMGSARGRGEETSRGSALPLGGRAALGASDGEPEASDSSRSSAAPAGSGASLSPRAATGLPDSMRKQWSAPSRRQRLDDVDEGDLTVLNTSRWKYASFFNRLRDDIDQHWDPLARLRARDPDGRINGTKTRRTRLLIVLNEDGSLHRVKLVRSCNVDYLDDEAIRAVRSAAPFPNPPAGMADPADGKFYLPFGFIVEMGKKGRIQRYRR